MDQDSGIVFDGKSRPLIERYVHFTNYGGKWEAWISNYRDETSTNRQYRILIPVPDAELGEHLPVKVIPVAEGGADDEAGDRGEI